MNRKNLIVSSVVVLAAIAGSIAIAQNSAQPGKDTKPAKAPATKPTEGAPEGFQLPPGWTMEDMQACMVAGTPGEQHKALMKGAGTWKGTCEMWMSPGAPGITSECVSTTTPIMEGRYLQTEHKGDMPGMGPYHGSGVNGFDNVSGKFVGTWIDNHSTGIMNGTGELSKDGKTLTWTMTYNCPINKKPVTMREVQTFTSDTTMEMEMFGNDPKSGKEFKLMQFKLTKQ